MPSQIPFWDPTIDVAGVIQSPGYEGPLFSPNPWDQILIDGKTLPGICEISKAEPKRRVDQKIERGKRLRRT